MNFTEMLERLHEIKKDYKVVINCGETNLYFKKSEKEINKIRNELIGTTLFDGSVVKTIEIVEL